MKVLGVAVNRTQRLVLGFAVLVWVVVAVILLVSPQIYDGSAGDRPFRRWQVDLGLLVFLSIPPALLALAVVRRWRWAFWLVLAAFLAGILQCHRLFGLTNEKIVFILPFQQAFKAIAWYFGFAKSHLMRYQP